MTTATNSPSPHIDSGADDHASGVVLQVSDLVVDIRGGSGLLRAVDGVSLEVRRGEVLGVVGESGSGKSITALSILRLLPYQAQVKAGTVVLGGCDLLALGDREIRAVRGRRIAMIFQDPLSSLNPLMTVGRQLVEAVRVHDRSVTASDALSRSADLLVEVGFREPARILRSYPHELSGGMRQRVMIVMAMTNRPDLIIADEPTTALDVTTQAQVLDSLQRAREELGSAMILISHDLGLIGERADRVNVMYNGRIVEAGTTTETLANPKHPYTIGLLASRPTLARRRRLEPIPGAPPNSSDVTAGCAFAPRCGLRHDRCDREVPVLLRIGGDTASVACYYAETSESSRQITSDSDAGSVSSESGVPDRTGAAVLSVVELVKDFGKRSKLFSRASPALRAVDSVSFRIAEGTTLALVGESGSGKSTVARAVLRLIEATSGCVEFRGSDVGALRGRQLRRFRARAQLVQQDPYSALNPRMTVGEAISEPLRIHGSLPRSQVASRVSELLESVGLQAEHAGRFPHEFSGGQRQRICIARALSVNPDLLVLDEPVSSLDVSIQAQILNLLHDIQRDRLITYLFITHDLAVVRSVADHVAVLYKGTIVETGPIEAVLGDPQHPYTQLLLAAVPDPARHGIARPATPISESRAEFTPTGCPFEGRCPKAQEICATARPPLVATPGGQLAACHFPGAGSP